MQTQPTLACQTLPVGHLHEKGVDLLPVLENVSAPQERQLRALLTIKMTLDVSVHTQNPAVASQVISAFLHTHPLGFELVMPVAYLLASQATQVDLNRTRVDPQSHLMVVGFQLKVEMQLQAVEVFLETALT